MTIDTVVGSVQATFGEPYNITVLEAPGTNGPEWTVPIQSLFCGLKIAADSVSVSREVESIAEKRTEADCQCGRGTSDAWSLMAISDMAIPVGRTPHFQYTSKEGCKPVTGNWVLIDIILRHRRARGAKSTYPLLRLAKNAHNKVHIPTKSASLTKV